MTEEEALKAAVDACGSEAELARRIEVTPQAVNQWIRKVRPVPAKQALAIEAATEGQVTRHALRPDLYPTEHRNAAA